MNTTVYSTSTFTAAAQAERRARLARQDEARKVRSANVKRIAVVAASVGIVGGIVATPAQASAPQPVLHGVVRLATTTPCAEEDSPNCYWNAGSVGNHRGHSFYSIRVGRKDCIVYWNRAYNRTHGYCVRP